MTASQDRPQSPSSDLPQEQVSQRRPWATSIAWALTIVGAGIALSATVNPLIGRRVHWDWTAALAVALFLLVTTATRRRWM